MRVKILFISLISIMLISCKSAEQKLQDKVDYTFQLLDEACTQPEVDMAVPLGFDLSFTESDFKNHCSKLIAENGGSFLRDGDANINTKAFGGKRTVNVDYFNYYSDPNTPTEYISSIQFTFNEFRNNSMSNGGFGKLKLVLDNTFDESWTTSEFDLNEAEKSSYKKYYKYWIRGNIAVEFYYDNFVGYATLEFFNMPKYGTRLFKDPTLGIMPKKSVKKTTTSTRNYDISNSVWDGSVWQVKKYLKSTLKDPDSYEGIEWSNVVKDGSVYRVRHKYRAKNSFGGYVVEEGVFVLNEQGQVIDVAY